MKDMPVGDWSAPAESLDVRHMDDLPDEWFAQILDLVPIRDIFVLMRVSKRWAAACRFIVRTRQSLIIGNDDLCRYYADYGHLRGWDWHRDQPLQLDNITVINRLRMPAMMKSLEQMENITQLCVYISGLNIRPFIQKFADQLTILKVDFAISVVGSVVFPHLTHLYCYTFNPKSSAAFPKLAELVIHISLISITHEAEKGENLLDMVFPSLKRLMIVNNGDNGQFIRRLIFANATTLEFLSDKNMVMKFDRVVTFEKLVELHCLSMDVDMIKSFPTIRRLTMRKEMTFALLNSLPADQMLSLNFAIGTDRALSESEDKQVQEVKVCAVVTAGNSNLKELCLSGCFIPVPNRTMDLGHSLISMLSKLHQLEKVSIGINHDHNEEHGDKIINSLVQQNANLRDVRFANIHLTAAAYASLAQLHHLSHITLDMAYDVGGENPNVAVLTLLRGSSRNVIRKLKLCNVRLDVDDVTREIQLMAQERGTTFERKDRFLFRVYKIHEVHK